MLTKRHWNGSELAAGSAKAGEVFPRHKGCTCARRGHAKDWIFAVSTTGFSRAFTIPRTTHHRPAKTGEANRGKTGHCIGQTRVDCHRRPLNTTGGKTTMCPGLVIHLEFEAKRIGERVSVRADRRAKTDDQAIQVISAQTRIIQSITNRLASKINGAAIEASAVR